MERTILSFTIVNTITVVAMVAIGGAIIGLGISLLRKQGVIPQNGGSQ